MRDLATFQHKLVRKIVSVLSSDQFFYVVIAVAIMQAVWYALSFRPWINDEARHFGNILIYSHYLSPFLGNQQPSWDYLGQVVRDGSFMFYYVMSWPLRLIQLFTSDTMVQVIGLRFVCIAFFIAGIVIYRRALFAISRIPKSAIHALFLMFVLIPSTAIMPGTINYDNLVFLLFAIVLLSAIHITKSRNVDFADLSALVIVGLFMAVVKWTSIALVAPVFIFILYILLRKHGLNVFGLFISAAKEASRVRLALVIGALIITAGLFVERPVLNMMRYGKPEPSCQAVIGAERCMSFHDYVANAKIIAQKPPDFYPANPVQYIFTLWIPKMADTADNLQENGAITELPIMKHFFDVAFLSGAFLVLIYMRDFWRNKQSRLLLIVVGAYLFLLALNEYQAYIDFGAPVAIRARYLIPVLPILLYFIMLALINIVGRYKSALLIIGVMILLVLTQGGGIITYSLTTPGKAYWPNSSVGAANRVLQNILHVVVIKE